MRYRSKFILLLLAAVLLLSGCSIYAVSDLYSLPKRTEQYTNLQSLVEAAMADREYCAPTSGDNQQTVQAADLDGDGLDEYLLFSRDSSDKPLKIFVFSGDGTEYFLLDTIESAGASFDQVEYVQMDGKPGYEIVVGRKISDQVVRSVSVYTMIAGQLEQVMTDSYTEFLCCDLDSDSRSEVFVLRPGESGGGIAMLYGMDEGVMERSQEVRMSEPAENIMRIMFGKLDDGIPAVYVASSVTDGSGIITDVYALLDDALTNVSLSNESGTSVQTLRNYYIYADDIDDDGVLELPSLINIRSMKDTAESTNQHLIRWYAMRSDGTEVDRMFTYHNVAGGWYLKLDGELAEFYTVEQKGSSYEFSLWNKDYTGAEKLLTIYVLTGQKREEQAVADNRFVLYRTETAIYAASLEVDSANYGMTQESLVECFSLIHQDWKTGET